MLCVFVFSELALDKMHATVGHIDLYNVYGPCISGSRPDGEQQFPVRLNPLPSGRVG